MDYENLIERLKSNRHPNGLKAQAATAIETLRADLARVTAELNELRAQWDMYGGDVGITETYKELERVKAERDAAIADWRGFCAKCAWNGKQYLADGKMDDRCRTCRENGKCNWKWRGIKKEH